MRALRRVGGLLVRPRETWLEIAAEGDTRRSLWLVYVPLLLALSWGGNLVLAVAEHGWEAPPPQAETRFNQAGNAIGSGWTVSLGAAQTSLLAAPAFVTVNLVAILFVAWRAGSKAPLYGGAANPAAAGKLAVYGWTPVWLGWPLMMIPALGGVVFLLAVALSLRLFALGAPRLLPPAAGFESAFGRMVAWRAGFVGALAAPLYAALLAAAVAWAHGNPFDAPPAGMAT